MGLGYGKYLEEGTKKLMEIGASPDVEWEERRFILDVFAEELVKHISDMKYDSDYERVLNTASVRYIDTKLSEGMSTPNLTNEDCDKLIKYCRRQQDFLNLFQQKKWAVQNLKINSKMLNGCESFFSNIKESNLIRDKILQADSNLSSGMEKARRSLSIDDCEKARTLFHGLVDSISECKHKGFALPKIKNENIEKVDREINDLSTLATNRYHLHSEIAKNDTYITRFLSQKDNTSDDDIQGWVILIKLCNHQKSLLVNCEKSGWGHPDVSFESGDLENITNRFDHYIKMREVDEEIVALRESMRSKDQYEEFYQKCETQRLNIEKCRKNQWRIPNIVITDPRELADAFRREKRNEDVRRKLVVFAVMVVIVIAVSLFGFQQYKKGRVQAPVSAVEALKGNVDDIYSQFEQAGFENIVTKEDETGWMPDKQVIGISVDGSNDFKKGEWINPNDVVQITYSSEGRIDVSNILKDWYETDYETIGEYFLDAGFTNVECSEEITYAKELNQQTEIFLNGLQYLEGACYLPKDAPVVITHYILKIIIDSNSKKFEGKNYEKVIEELEEKGFVNIQWWGNGELLLGLIHKDGEIKTIMINGLTDFTSSDEFLYDVPIEIEVYTK